MAVEHRANSTLRLYPLLLLAAAVVLVLWPVCLHDFARWDDTQTLSGNPDLNPPTLASVGRYWDFRQPYMDLYVPFTYTVWAAIAEIAYEPPPDGGLNPYIFHAANLGLHVLSACLVFVILRRLLRNGPAAWLGALLFAVHPVQVEPVAWASGLKDVLAGLLSLTALWQYIEYASPARQQQPARHLHYALATVAFILAMLSKPSAVVTPLLAAILDLLLLRQSLRRLLVPIGLWLLLSLPVILIARHAQPAAALPFVPPLWARPLVALDALAFYLWHLVFPLQLGIDYGRSPQWLWHSRQIYFTWIAPLALLLATLLWRRRDQARAPQTVPDSQPPALPLSACALASILLFAAALLPMLGLVPFDFQIYSTVTDHYLYLPMLAPALLLAAFLARHGKPAASLATIAILLLAVQAFRQTWYWRDSDSLFSHSLEVNPGSLAANVNYANALFDRAEAARRSGNTALAREYHLRRVTLYQRAIATTPVDAVAHANLGNTYFSLGRFPQAIEQYEIALKLSASSASLHTALACAYAATGNDAAAIGQFREALALDPADSVARSGLAAALRRHAASTTGPSTLPARP